ncbi:MAG TPA: helix-turn-helix domain-containing protein [Geminicoccaceae bacterium]|nr:helix-turn-helix domain-containing protein [Geminicoccaceae bacterium]
MATARTWTIKGVSGRTRDAVLDAALAAGLSVGEWVERALARAAEEARNPRPPAASRGDVAELIDARLKPIEEAIGRLAGHPAPREGEAGRGTRPESAGGTATPQPLSERAAVGPARASGRGEAPQVKAPGRPRRRLTESVRARVEELHGAGHTVYAISKELGVPYSTVRTHVRSLGEGALP